MRVFITLFVVLAVLACVQAFAPINSLSRTPMRSSTIVMDGKSRTLRDRIKSIKNTRRITEAMRLVAAARVRKAQDAVLRTRPMMASMQGVFKSLVAACAGEDVELPILEVRDVKKVTIVLVTGDRGLCGGYNSNVIKATQRRINKLVSQGIEPSLVLVGRKGEQWFGRRPTPISGVYALGNIPSPVVGSNLANFLIAQFLRGK